MNRANSHNSYIVSFQNDETSELLKFGKDIGGKEMSMIIDQRFATR